MSENMKNDPLEDILQKHKAAAGIKDTAETTSPTPPPPVATPIVEPNDGLVPDPRSNDPTELIDMDLDPTFDYGDNDIDEEIANEDAARQQSLIESAKEQSAKKESKP